MILIYNDEGISQDSLNALLKYYSSSKTKLVTGADLQNATIFNHAKMLKEEGFHLPTPGRNSRCFFFLDTRRR